MRALYFAALAALVAMCLPIAAGAGQIVPLINDNFNSYDVGKTFVHHSNGGTVPKAVYGDPVIQSTWYGVSGALVGTYYNTVIDSGDPTAGQVLDLYEDNTLGAGNNNAVYFYHLCKKVTFEVFHAQCDLMLPQNTAGFTVKISHVSGKYPNTGTPGQANTGNSWAAGICFEGNQPWVGTVSSPGRISYQTIQTNQLWVANPVGTTYAALTWYTLRFELDVSAKKYHVFFGPRLGTLTEITPTAGVEFIRRANSTGQQVDRVNCISFDTSEKLGGTPAETAGHLYIDNVYADGSLDMATPTSIIEVKKLVSGFPGLGAGGSYDPPEPGTYLQTYLIGGGEGRFRVASVGTDQLGSFFYLVDGDRTADKANAQGIRVRQDPIQVYRDPADFVQGNRVVPGDIVDISGYVQKATDNGIMVRTNGEKEILAVTIEAYSPGHFSQPFRTPKPLGMINKTIGGADMFFEGLNESWVGDPFVPGVYRADNLVPPPPYFKEYGLNNVGAYGRFWGRVTYVSPDLSPDDNQKYYPYFYINDGSNVNDGSLPDGFNPQVGVRVLMSKTRSGSVANALANLMGKYVMVTGVVGAIAACDLIPAIPAIPTSSANNVRLIRAAEEPWSDANQNGLYDPGETFNPGDDLNKSGAYDGIIVLD